jgi:beta-fructofuranosidase
VYAASAFTDESGEPGLIFWLRGIGDVEGGWMGVHSLPYRLEADGDDVVVLTHPTLLDRRLEKADDGVLPSVADLEWAARRGDSLVAENLFRLDATGRAIEVTVAGNTHAMPWRGGPVRIVLDGPVLEVFGDCGVLAAPVPATGRDGVLTGGTERAIVHRLA